ncbi:MAG: hypothetical protein F6K19_32330, partial [Cyanothece sp. SIO1E1]|nr:hypothetical protein [Cyanothece sp. SIO1E1]
APPVNKAAAQVTPLPVGKSMVPPKAQQPDQSAVNASIAPQPQPDQPTPVSSSASNQAPMNPGLARLTQADSPMQWQISHLTNFEGLEQALGETAAKTTSAPTTAATPLSMQQIPQSSQGIYDFLQLSWSGTAGTHLSWLPLTQQAVAEVTPLERIGQFIVFKLSTVDYQHLWAVQDATREPLPDHGFIDYLQRIIVIRG